VSVSLGALSNRHAGGVSCHCADYPSLALRVSGNATDPSKTKTLINHHTGELGYGLSAADHDIDGTANDKGGRAVSNGLCSLIQS